MPAPDSLARRSYWTEQLELGYQLVQQIQAWPVQESLEPFASLPAAAAAAGIEMLFSSSKIAGGLDRIHWIRRSLVPDVLAI
ncbi:MAG: hypothetical protein ACKPJD_33595, partial [Planctomycetaceae bacterium]